LQGLSAGIEFLFWRGGTEISEIPAKIWQNMAKNGLAREVKSLKYYKKQIFNHITGKCEQILR